MSLYRTVCYHCIVFQRGVADGPPQARDYALERGIIIADTKFEFGLDTKTDEIVLVDEVLTPDSSRFWPAPSYEVGKTQDSFDKQYLRNWLTSQGLKGKQGVEMPEEIVRNTAAKYQEGFERLVGRKLADLIQDTPREAFISMVLEI